MATTRNKKILCITDDQFDSIGLPIELPEWCDVTSVAPEDVHSAIEESDYDGFLILSNKNDFQWQFWHLAQNARWLDQMPDGLAITDQNNKIIWANKRLTNWFDQEPIVGLNFFDALGKPAIVSGIGSPMVTALKTGSPSTAVLKCAQDHYYRLSAAPVAMNDGTPQYNVVTISDISTDTLHLQKLEAIHRAGAELADLTPEEVVRMNVEERIELLKANILHYTQDLLKFDVVEIRLIDRKTNRVEPLLSVGIDSEESKRPLYAEAQGNGVTGFVCATGKSYLCEDTTNDLLYVDGLIGAKSSLTVPLMHHDEVIGSFNVESPQIQAFAESDVQLLEIFARDIARALNTLELLVAQKTDTAHQSIEAIDLAVAQPIDEILNDTVHVIENLAEQDPNVRRRLRNILRHSRNIKQVIHQIWEQSASAEDVTGCSPVHSHPKLRGARILVIDAEEEIRQDAHALLERYGCIVETAHEGIEAMMMIRNCDPDDSYKAIIADIRLPDLSGFQLLTHLKEIMDEPPLILMTGFGYDPGHSIVKARQAGLKSYAVLYKPFRLDQLLEIVEKMVTGD